MGDSLFGPRVYQRLRDAGLIGPEPVQRIVIDVPHDDYGVMYVQHVGSTRMLDIIVEEARGSMSGLQVRVIDAETSDA